MMDERINPLYLAPIVGFAMWHLGRVNSELGRRETPEEVMERIHAKGEWAGMPEDLLQRAMDRAILNITASDMLAVLDEASYTAE